MKILRIVWDPKGGMPKSYALSELPKIEKQFDGMTLPSPKGRLYSRTTIRLCVENGLRKFQKVMDMN